MTKKITFSVLTFLIIMGEVDAQTISLGLKGGLNIASQEIPQENLLENKSILRYHIGFYATTMVSSRVGIQLEGFYSRLGSENTYDRSGSPLTLTYNYEYINMPLLFRVNIVPAFNIHFGPQAGYCLSAKNTDGSTTMNIMRNINQFDFAFAMGVGFDVGSINGGLRYNLGMSDVITTSSTVKNNAIQFYVGYCILKPKK